MEMFSMKAILIMVFVFLFLYLILEMCRYETAPILGRGADLEHDFHRRLIILDRLMSLRDEDLLRLKGDILSLNEALAGRKPVRSLSQPQSGDSAFTHTAVAVHQDASAAQVFRNINKDIKNLRQNGNRYSDLKIARHRVFLILTLLFLINVLLVLL